MILTHLPLLHTDLPHFDWKASCHDNGLRGKGQSTGQPEWHHQCGQTHQPSVKFKIYTQLSLTLLTEPNLTFTSLAGWTTWSGPCTLLWIQSSWMPGNHLCCPRGAFFCLTLIVQRAERSNHTTWFTYSVLTVDTCRDSDSNTNIKCHSNSTFDQIEYTVYAIRCALWLPSALLINRPLLSYCFISKAFWE